jgi:hypothetical protein
MSATRNRYGSAVAAFARCCALRYSDDASVASFTASRTMRNCDNSAIAAFSGRSTRRHPNHTAIATFPRCIAVADFDLLAILPSSKMV